MKEFTVICVVTFCILLALCMALDRSYCHEQWRKFGLPISWGPMQGCLLQLPDGRWIPQYAIREINIKGER